MSEPFLGEIRMTGWNFASRGWALCNGQLMSIAQNTALFSLLGTTFGGDGRTTFALPNLQGRVAVHPGQGPGLSPYDLGQVSGSENVTVTVNQMPAHNHLVSPKCGSSIPQSPLNDPTNNYSTATDSGASGLGIYTAVPDAAMGATPSTVAGGNQPVSIIQPLLCVNFII